MQVLITGGNKGLGLSLAQYLDKLGYDLIIIGRSEFSFKFTNKMTYISEDLTNINNILNKIKNYKIDIIINNAGLGFIGKSEDCPNLVDINIKALVELSKYAIKNNIKLLNISSIGAILPGININDYYTSKAFVYLYTKNLWYEYKKHTISVALPGPLNTEFNKRHGYNDDANYYDKDMVAKIIINQFLKGKKKIIPGFKIKLLYLFRNLIPTPILAHFVSKSQLKKVKK